jgi:quinol monooxygenase YgiN
VFIQLVRYTFAPEDVDRVAGILTELRDLSRQEPGILAFVVARSEEKPNVFALWEEYRDEAALEAHAETEHFARLVVRGIRLLAKERVAERLFPLD